MSKLLDLREAVRLSVAAGSTVCFGFTHNRSHAAVYEICRQFRDTRSLNVVATGLLDYATMLAAAGVVRRLESAFAGNTYPAPSPSAVLGQLMSQAPNDPNFTNLAMVLRLHAGAMGWPFTPVAGMGPESGPSAGADRARIADPFGDGQVTLLRALNPDVTFLHVPLADTDGNAAIAGPDGESCWAAWAARKVVVTADRVVSPAEFRAISPKHGFPGQRVSAVVHAPYGAHPQSQFIWDDCWGVASYAEDYEMRRELRQRSRRLDAMHEWLEEWVFPLDHDGYLARVGEDRLAELRRRADSDPDPVALPDGPPSEEERAAVFAKRFTTGAIEDGRYSALFAGIGLSHLAAWAAEEEVREKGLSVDLVAETGMYGFRPAKGDPYLFNRANLASSLFHHGFHAMLGALAGPRAEGLLVLLAAGQISLRGGINSSWAANGRFIVGSGGANDLAYGNADCLICMPLKPGRFAEPLPFVTSPGRRVVAVATDLAVLRPLENGGELHIAEVAGDDLAQGIEAVRAAAGYPLKVVDRPLLMTPVTEDEVRRLRAFDPRRDLLA